ncbi:MAG: WecB/TagA/CpsF family glycosyltransferase [Planctomycetota bacterium]
MAIDRLTLAQATDRVLDWCAAAPPSRCRYVVTPNVDHVVMHRARRDLRQAYAQAAMVLADGAPLVAASRLLGQPLPERVAGSDLTPAVLASAGAAGRPPLRTFLLGAAPGVAEIAARRIAGRHPMVEVVGVHCPPLGFEQQPAATNEALAAVAAAQPDLLIVGLGAPKQELWVSEHHSRLEAKVALCVGATIDFLAGHKRRSPKWMQRSGLEWAHRLASEPGRLASRYARDAWVFPQIVWQEWRRGSTPGAQA